MVCLGFFAANLSVANWSRHPSPGKNQPICSRFLVRRRKMCVAHYHLKRPKPEQLCHRAQIHPSHNKSTGKRVTVATPRVISELHLFESGRKSSARALQSVSGPRRGVETGPRNATPLDSASDECQEVRIDHVGMRGHHAVREAWVDLQRAMLEQLSLQQ